VTVLGVLLERALYLLLCSGGCWTVDLVTMLAVDPYANLKTLFYPTDALWSSFL